VPTTLSEVKIATLGEFTQQIELALSRTHDLVWYRGSGNSAYKLIPTLYRHPPINDSPGLIELESKILNRFRHRSVPYLERSLQNDWEYLFLMQHFGIPTRLLDWTENPYITLYFALTSAFFDTTLSTPGYTKDAAVWILDPSVWNRHVLQGIGFQGTILSPQDETLKGYAPVSDITLMNIFPIALYGTHNSPRIVAQRGVFTIFGKNTTPMEEVYVTANFPQDSLLKLTIPLQNIAALLKAITSSGITDSVIYPDMDGLAKEIKRFFEFRV
jgi:FRG domain